MPKNKQKILFCAYECAPFFKRGGLGDVALGLPKALSDLGHQPRVIIPKYKQIEARKWGLKLYRKNIPVQFGPKKHRINIYRTNLPQNRGVAWFIDHPIFRTANIFDKRSLERYVFYSKCVLDFIRWEKWRPDVIHANDWHTGAIIVYLNKLKKEDKWFDPIGTLYTTHNLAYQGKGKPNYKKWGLESDDFKNKKELNLMSEGILGADLINTVSKTYAEEILAKKYGQGLEKFLKKRKNVLFGIVNGVDMEYFNPATDKELPKRYSKTSLSRKAINKEALQREAKLPRQDIAVISMISRLARQKGFNLVIEALPLVLEKYDCQAVIMGHGSKIITKKLKKLEKQYPGKIKFFNFFGSTALAKLIYAGSDIFLMPSRFEPCGLGQLIAMRYGTVPVVRRTGGLNDTVDQVRAKKGTGFLFKKFNFKDFQQALEKALRAYSDSKKWKQIQKNAMAVDTSWENAAKKYIKLYKKI